MFDVKNSADFYRKSLDDYMSLMGNTEYAGYAINCALSCYHLSEWIWGDWLKSDHEVKAKLGIRTCDEFKGWVEKNCRYFKTLQSIANGSKHFSRHHASKTAAVAVTYGEEGREWEEQTLIVEIGDDEKRSIEDVVKEMLNFWHEFLEENSPYKILPTTDEEEKKWL